MPLGAIHRMENPGKSAMILIEVQTGTYSVRTILLDTKMTMLENERAIRIEKSIDNWSYWSRRILPGRVSIGKGYKFMV